MCMSIDLPPHRVDSEALPVARIGEPSRPGRYIGLSCHAQAIGYSHIHTPTLSLVTGGYRTAMFELRVVDESYVLEKAEFDVAWRPYEPSSSNSVSTGPPFGPGCSGKRDDVRVEATDSGSSEWRHVVTEVSTVKAQERTQLPVGVELDATLPKGDELIANPF